MFRLFDSFSKGDQRDGNRVPISSRLVADLVKVKQHDISLFN